MMMKMGVVAVLLRRMLGRYSLGRRYVVFVWGLGNFLWWDFVWVCEFKKITKFKILPNDLEFFYKI